MQTFKFEYLYRKWINSLKSDHIIVDIHQNCKGCQMWTFALTSGPVWPHFFTTLRWPISENLPSSVKYIHKRLLTEGYRTTDTEKDPRSELAGFEIYCSPGPSEKLLWMNRPQNPNRLEPGKTQRVWGPSTQHAKPPRYPLYIFRSQMVRIFGMAPSQSCSAG